MKKEPKHLKTKCQLNVAPFYQCCCTCIHHVRVNHHCGHEPEPTRDQKKDGCSCSVQKGWACAGFIGDGVIYDNWGAHSCGCEMHTTKEVADKGSQHIKLSQDLLFFCQYPSAPMFDGKRGKEMAAILRKAIGKLEPSTTP